ncbi:MAG: hypothetical protein ACRBFS_14240 [Aureispira sp.]
MGKEKLNYICSSNEIRGIRKSFYRVGEIKIKIISMEEKKMYEWLLEIAKSNHGFTALSTMINDQSKVKKREVEKAIEASKDIFKKRVAEGRKYFCAFADTQNSFGEKGFRRALEIANTSEMIIGGWYEDEKVYFDSVHNYFTLEAAKETCLKEKQLAFAYFDQSGNYAGIYSYNNNNNTWTKKPTN